jgi:hypothetical protein
MIGDILRAVADLHGVTVAEIRGGRRYRHFVQARHAAIWVIRQVKPGMSEQLIAEAVGLTDHTTVVYALHKLDQRVTARDEYAANLWAIVQQHKGADPFAPVQQPQRRAGSPDRWAIWNASQRGTAYVETA